MPDYLEDVPLRDDIMAMVGATLYLSASPDQFDGLSSLAFHELKTAGVSGFQVYEQLGKVGAPENFRLPEGFTQHFRDEVLPDLEIIRADPAKRDEYRAIINDILHHPKRLDGMYRRGGETYSGITSRIAGTNRSGKFYDEERVLPIGQEVRPKNLGELVPGGDEPRRKAVRKK